ncbi:acetyltransferase [Xanthomonas oryzae]|uniref:Acetyltransferase n=1 Tax=Xanthomonas oryzae TaxID=347 RepID=A0AAP1F0P8_9XANT|nr:acetyltransferase [Xanthomonas oryzae]QBG86146.1 acetyltransferase [Xanthomonas oryzae]
MSDPVLDIVIDGKACDGSGASLGQGERCLSTEPGYWLGCAYWNQG